METKEKEVEEKIIVIRKLVKEMFKSAKDKNKREQLRRELHEGVDRVFEDVWRNHQ